MKTAIYPGTFDPFTNGHRYALEFGLSMFDQIIVAIGVNPKKTSHLFDLDERLELIRASTTDLPGVCTDSYENKFLPAYAKSKEITHIIRGMRDITDFREEYIFQETCRRVNAQLHFVQYLCPPEVSIVSSTSVKGLCGPEGWENLVSQFVSPAVLEKLKEKFPATKP